jgi:hypothetical protein
MCAYVLVSEYRLILETIGKYHSTGGYSSSGIHALCLFVYGVPQENTHLQCCVYLCVGTIDEVHMAMYDIACYSKPEVKPLMHTMDYME